MKVRELTIIDISSRKGSRLDRNMLEVVNIINQLSKSEIEVVFVRQPELSTTGPQKKLLLAIYSYFAVVEREFISMRTKQGLEKQELAVKNWGGQKVAVIKKGCWICIVNRISISLSVFRSSKCKIT